MTVTDDEAVLRRAVGQETLVRGRHYARCGAVLTVQWAPDGDRVYGQVRGNAARPYTAVAVLDPSADGSMRTFAGTCTCPVGTDCKHSVALALVRPRTVRVPSWEQRLAGLELEPPRLPAAAGARPGIALQFEPDAATGPLTRLTLRPVVPGRGGGWVRTGISWSNLHLHAQPGYGRPGVHPEHLRLLGELRALDLGGTGGYWTAPGAALDLVDFASRRLWDVLAEATAAGLPLVQSGKGGASRDPARRAVRHHAGRRPRRRAPRAAGGLHRARRSARGVRPAPRRPGARHRLARGPPPSCIWLRCATSPTHSSAICSPAIR